LDEPRYPSNRTRKEPLTIRSTPIRHLQGAVAGVALHAALYQPTGAVRQSAIAW
jgi:hypothetical protein